VWHYWFFYWTLDLFRQCGIIGFSIGLWTRSDSVALFVFLWDFGTVPIVWHYLFFYGTLDLFQQCGIICFFHFAIGLWNCSDSVALLFFLLDFGTFPTVCQYCFFIFLLDFGSIPIVCNIFFPVLYGTLELFRQCGIIGFSIGLWNNSVNMALFVFLLDFDTVSTVWYYLYIYWTLELFRQRSSFCISM